MSSSLPKLLHPRPMCLWKIGREEVYICVVLCLCLSGEWWWSPLLEELQLEGSCVQADSWSMVVEPTFLQTLHKDLIKQQDVIYG